MPRKEEGKGARALPFRNALADHADVPTHIIHDNAPESPTLTIAIPTFRRPALLAESIRSAASQYLNREFEILVVDNDPEASGWATMLKIAPDLASAPIRYVVNTKNIGMLGNWNRCISMARGEWLTILNDDDLLDPNFAETMLSLLVNTGADGLVCGKRTLDQREKKPRGLFETLLWVGKEVIANTIFRGRETRPITARQMFWGNPVGNPVGFMSRTALFRELGGFHPEEYPSADYFLFTRFVLHFRLDQAHRVLASIRLAENESMREDVLYGFLQTEYQIQQALASTVLPRWWARISPWLIGYHVERIERLWRTPLDPDLVQHRVGTRYRPGRHLWLQGLRAMIGGF
jgi:glycosyltransferase involved in cell wall biosynthesis